MPPIARPRSGTSPRILWCIVAGLLVGGLCLGRALMAEGSLTEAMAIHATLMIVAWGGMMPLGGIVARYFKVVPGQGFPEVVDNPFWWNWHRGLQYGGLAVATVALAVIFWETGGSIDTLHGSLGVAVMGLGGLQLLSPLFRGRKGGPTDQGADPSDPASWRGDHYDMTLRRHLFEAWHKTMGWGLIVLAAVTILLGIQLVGAPSWLLVLAGMLQAAMLCGLIDGRLRLRWVDTYAALWGPDPEHPGNRKGSGAPPSKTAEQSHEFGLPPRSGLGEHGLQLSARGLDRDASEVGGLLQAQPAHESIGEPRLGARHPEDASQKAGVRSIACARIRDGDEQARTGQEASGRTVERQRPEDQR